MKNFFKDGKPSASFVAGSIALLFLIIGYQSALFIRKAAVTRLIANHDHPDTVYLCLDGSAPLSSRPVLTNDSHVAGNGPVLTNDSHVVGNGRILTNDSHVAGPVLTNDSYVAGKVSSEYSVLGRHGRHSPDAESIRRANTERRCECFIFDPNTVSIDDLMRLGFSLKQAESIDNYRKKGGRFRRKNDFAKSFVVEDSVFRRLERYIEIPKLDINKADSAEFVTLPGIGKFFASKMVSYREDLHGYSFPEQLMDIWHFDKEKYEGLCDLIVVGPSSPYPLWTLPEDALARHPYIDRSAAHGIVLFRENNAPEAWSVENLIKAGILDMEKGSKLSRCRIAGPHT